MIKFEVMVLAISLSLSGCGGSAEVAEELVAKPVSAPAPAPVSRISLEGQHNFRDLGGYKTTDGRTVKSGEVFRSGELPHLTDADVEQLEELELQTVVNFLLPEEIEAKGPDRLPDDTTEVHIPISGEESARQTMMVTAAIRAAEFEKIPPEMNPQFHRLLIEEGKSEYAALLRQAADPSNRPLVFHCSHGVHRTGTATAILLSALGVPWETIREDYLLTNEYRQEDVRNELARVRQMAAQKLGVSEEEVDMTNVEAFYVLDGSYIDGSLEAAVEGYGSMDEYLRAGLGLTDEEIERLRAELLE